MLVSELKLIEELASLLQSSKILIDRCAKLSLANLLCPEFHPEPCFIYGHLIGIDILLRDLKVASRGRVKRLLGHGLDNLPLGQVLG